MIDQSPAPPSSAQAGAETDTDLQRGLGSAFARIVAYRLLDHRQQRQGAHLQRVEARL